MKRKITGYRYELHYKDLKVGLFRHFELERAYEQPDIEFSYFLYWPLTHTFNFLKIPSCSGKYGLFYFTKEGFDKIQPYIKEVRKILKPYGIKVVLKRTQKHCKHSYDDEFQFAD